MAPRELTRLVEGSRRFSFFRLGDGELRFLLEAQNGPVQNLPQLLRPSCQCALGNPGLTDKDYVRLLTSFERCSLVDVYGDLPYNEENLQRLKWKYPQNDGTVISSGRVGFIFYWIHSEFRKYLTRHRCLFCGAEAALLCELLKEPEYRQIAQAYWPYDGDIYFLQPRRDGRFLSEDLDRIKEDIARFVVERCIDTVFLALGGAAKIIAYELAEELGIRAIDVGSALRSLTYSGSDGYAGWRAPHHVFLVRVPFALYMRALRRAHPDYDAVALLAKAHAQLCLELHRKTPLQSNTSDIHDLNMYDPSKENLRYFREGYQVYKREYRSLWRKSEEAKDLVREFDGWRRRKGLGWDGKLFRAGVLVMGCIRNVVQRLAWRLRGRNLSKEHLWHV